MQRNILIIAMTMCCIVSFGKSNKTSTTPDNEVKELTQKVSSLEHELNFLSLSFDLYKINTDLSLFSAQLRSTVTELQNFIYRSYYTYDTYKMYKHNYDLSMKKVKAFEGLILATKFKYDSTCSAHSFFETELNSLEAAWKTIEAGYAVLKNTGEVYNLCLNSYEESL